jgi:hypothetical protein
MARLLGCRIHGIIGVSFLAGFVTEIDYQRHTLRLYNPATYTPAATGPDRPRAILLNLTLVDLAQGLPNVAITGALPDGSACSFLLDTGFAGIASVERSAALRSGLLTPHTPSVPAPAYSATHRFTSFQIPASRLTVGGIDLTGKTIQIHDQPLAGHAGLIGNLFPHNYRVTIDYPRHKLRLEPTAAVEEQNPAEQRPPAPSMQHPTTP